MLLFAFHHTSVKIFQLKILSLMLVKMGLHLNYTLQMELNYQKLADGLTKLPLGHI